MSSANRLLNALSNITGTGNFLSQGAETFFLPSLDVDGVGEIAFPLPVSQARELIAVAETAPYGMGSETVLDQSVRKCWQVDASHFRIQSPAWQKFLATTLESVSADLGISGAISAHPYKLLIYGKGGHFKAHRDSEKLDAMFGTLIIALPSAHEGGRLSIRHDGRELTVDFSKTEHLHEFQHAAFFADCEHEVDPVRSGYRCCLVFNLRLDEGNPAALNLPLNAHAESLLAPLSAIKEECQNEITAILLEHSYTEANFSLRNLKGNDLARARALLAAARETGFTAHLGLFTYHQTGLLEESNYRRKRRHWEDEDDDTVDGTMGEIYEESRVIDQWRDADDASVHFGRWFINEDSIINLEDLETAEPDQKEAEGYTGNAGCTMDYWYRRAAIVFWPKEDDEFILCQHDFAGACRTLASMVSDETKSPSPKFHRLAHAVVTLMPQNSYTRSIYHASQLKDHPFHITLESLARARSRDLLEKLLTEMPEDAWGLCDTALWKTLYETFGVDVFQDFHHQLLKRDADAWRHILFPVLDALLSMKEGTSIALPIAVSLATLKPKPAPNPGWNTATAKTTMGDRSEARILLSASHLLAFPKDREAALQFLLADQSLDYMRHVLAPVLLESENLRSVADSLFAELHGHTKESLAEEVARPLLPFPDWTRPCPMPNAQSPLRMGSYPSQSDRERTALHAVAAFMADPDAHSREFRYAEAIRRSLENFIHTHALDIDHTTLRKGSPHALVCTKNANSYRRALVRRAEDEALLTKLDNI